MFDDGQDAPIGNRGEPAPDVRTESSDQGKPPVGSTPPDVPPLGERVTSRSNVNGTSTWPPVGWRELAVVAAMVVLADLTIYRAEGFAGVALFLFAAPILLMAGMHRPRISRATWIVAAMTWTVAARSAWLGGDLQVAVGIALLFATATCLAGGVPHVFTVMTTVLQTAHSGMEGARAYDRAMRKFAPAVPWFSVLLPAGVVFAFMYLFVVANPNLVAFVSERAELIVHYLQDWFLFWSPWELAFWVAVAWTTVGLLRPKRLLSWPTGGSTSDDEVSMPAPSRFYAPYRNTLWAVIGLFAVYLVFEFQTLWFREFPEGFYYSGYAHEGAAWLTVALGLATMILSTMFRGTVLGDPRLGRLRVLAWVWSFQNLLLAAAVYNHVTIYMGFNGLTRMRMVAVYGITTVVVGFLLVLWKIQFRRDFVWLVQRQLWTLAIAVYLFAITPVDLIVMRYNVSRILAGDPAPSVEITEHAINAEGVVELLPLLEAKDEIIREGIGAMMAEREIAAEERVAKNSESGWTTFQGAHQRELRTLRDESDRWADYRSNARLRKAAIKRFHTYAYQWY